MANLIFSILSEYNSKGLNKAKKDVSAFEKNLKSLAKTLGVAFSAAAIVNFSKKAVAAFAADEKAAKSLEIQLNNTGYAFSAPNVEYYIANLQKMTGVLDDQLRPAFQTLLTASGSLVKSQKALAVALDVSAGTGRSVEEVSMALAKGFTGQTSALTRLGAGLDAATLKTGDMDLILTELGNKFSGQSQARLETYAGKMDVLKVSAANASETIGKGLIDALSQIGKDKNIGTLGTSLEKVASVIANVVVGLGTILGKVVSIGKAIFEKLQLDKIIGFLYKASGISFLANLGASQNKPTSNFTYSLGSGAATEIARVQELKIRKQLNAQLAKEIELKKLRDKYDLERIGLMAALNQATDEETRLRLAEKLAILDGDASQVDDYLALSESMNDLIDSTNTVTNAFNGAAAAILTAGQKVAYGLGVSPSQIGTGGAIIATSPGSVGPTLSNAAGIAGVAINQGMLGKSQEAIDLSISLGFTNTSNITDALTRAVAEALIINNKNGLPTAPAGFL
jgi:uncharacterized protein YfiM (DUF2279 family)